MGSTFNERVSASSSFEFDILCIVMMFFSIYHISFYPYVYVAY